MKLSWRLGEIAGIGVYVHATFSLLIGWVALRSWLDGGSAAAALSGVAFMLALFACVVLHELGHALAARRYGIATRDITLLPIGGLARLERMPEKPGEELVVALAGPAVNVALAVMLAGALVLSGGASALGVEGSLGGSFLAQLALVNVFLVAFNLLPAFPMDGGRVVRSLLAMRRDYVSATTTAARLGKMMALLFVVVGLAANPMLVLIGAFVWMGASAEASVVRARWQEAPQPGRAPTAEARSAWSRTGPAAPVPQPARAVPGSVPRVMVPVVSDGRIVFVTADRPLTPAADEARGAA